MSYFRKIFINCNYVLNRGKTHAFGSTWLCYLPFFSLCEGLDTIQIHENRKFISFPSCLHFKGGCGGPGSAYFTIVFKTSVKENYVPWDLKILNHIFFTPRNHQNQERYCVCSQPLLIVNYNVKFWIVYHLSTTNAYQYWLGFPILR